MSKVIDHAILSTEFDGMIKAINHVIISTECDFMIKVRLYTVYIIS